MRFAFLLVCCIWCHIIDDYVLQGCLASMKQKSWWAEKVNDLDSTMYKHDYLIALAMHAMSWSFSIMVPIIIAKPFCFSFYVVAFCVNSLVHGLVDHAKANMKLISLVTDQMIHLIQITLTLLLWMKLAI